MNVYEQLYNTETVISFSEALSSLFCILTKPCISNHDLTTQKLNLKLLLYDDQGQLISSDLPNTVTLSFV